MAEVYLGKEIRLISKHEVRYEGKLIEVNSKISTITLSDVRAFGTEDRALPEYAIKPHPEIIATATFSVDQIKKLTVVKIKRTRRTLEDPAILAHSSAPVRASAPAQAKPQAAAVAAPVAGEPAKAAQPAKPVRRERGRKEMPEPAVPDAPLDLQEGSSGLQRAEIDDSKVGGYNPQKGFFDSISNGHARMTNAEILRERAELNARTQEAFGTAQADEIMEDWKETGRNRPYGGGGRGGGRGGFHHEEGGRDGGYGGRGGGRGGGFRREGGGRGGGYGRDGGRGGGFASAGAGAGAGGTSRNRAWRSAGAGGRGGASRGGRGRGRGGSSGRE